ncbi:MAG TPA: hypothetical protein VEV17_20630 [Bryobacteraceae bacterium]|nr:hypothetical protein [Bryobacteraceae bacterium]
MKSSTSLAVVLGLAAALLSGCKKNIQNNEAVRQGIMNYLAKRSDLLAMDVRVTSVAFRQDEATALVRFQAKNNSSPNAGMTMQYVLERKGSEWVVKGRAGGDSHTGMPQGAPGAPGAPGVPGAPGANGSGSIGAMPQTLPPGHPSVGSGGAQPSGSLPPGHPAIGAEKK